MNHDEDWSAERAELLTKVKMSIALKEATTKETIGSAVLYKGDCLDVLQSLGEVDWCVTSPPYNLNKQHSGGGTTKQTRAPAEKYKKWYDDDLSEDLYQEQQIEVLSMMQPIVRHSIFYNHRIRYAWHGRNKNAPPCKVYHPMQWLCNFPIWCEIIWDRCGTSTPTSRFGQSHELIYQIGKPGPDRLKRSYGINDVWRIPPAKSEGHVCAFPVQLVEKCLAVAHRGDSVLDPYMGSGTTGVAAIKMGMSFVGIEQNSKYFDMACERLYQSQRQKDLF